MILKLNFSARFLLFAAALNTVLASDESPANMNVLENLSYYGIYEHPITLKDGVYEGAPFVPEGAARPRISLAKKLYITGDLNMDGKQDIAVLLNESSGGSGNNTYLAVVSQQNGKWVNIATRLIGNRVQIRNFEAKTDKLVLELVVAGPEEPLCCPTLKLQNIYRLEQGTLIEEASDRLGRLSVTDLEGVSWKLTRLAWNEYIPEGIVITAVFEAGKVSGSAGCNRYFADLKGENPQDISIGPVGATRMACPQSAMETEDRYLSTLQKVNRFSFMLGELALSYRDGDAFGTMLFLQDHKTFKQE